MSFRLVARRVLSFVGVFTALSVCWTAAYYATDWLYGRTGLSFREPVRHVITAAAGFFLFGCVVWTLSRFHWMKRRQDDFLTPILDAMQSIAEGNFTVDLSRYEDLFKDDRRSHPYAKIVSSVNEMAEKLGEMETMRQEFISNVSHEIQSPLTSISGFAHALQGGELSESERRHYLQIIESESRRMSKLSDNLLKLTSLEAEYVPLDIIRYRLDHQLRRIILANEPQWADKELLMEVDLDPVAIAADEEMMDQVWINLLGNSIKFTPTGGTIRVLLSATETGGCRVTIEDTGIGMDSGALMHMFERFYKADTARDRSIAGNGLGLSIVKKILTLHNASIRAESTPGRGTTIYVDI